MKRLYYFSAGVALGAMATRRTRRAKEAARAALAARLTPSAIAADLADAIAEIGNAVGAFGADLRQGAANRRAMYRPMVDGATGAIAMLAPDQLGPVRPMGIAEGGAPVADAFPAGAVVTDVLPPPPAPTDGNTDGTPTENTLVDGMSTDGTRQAAADARGAAAERNRRSA